MLNKKILVKSITNLSEARYCAGMFIDFMSFDLSPDSEYFVTKKKFDEIRGWVSGVAVIGSLESEDSGIINQTIEEYNLNGFLFSQYQYSLLPLVNTEIKILQWDIEDINFLPDDIEDDVVILIISENSIQEIIPQLRGKMVLQGFSFENVKYSTDELDGFAFMSSFEKQVGINASGELMEAFEYIEDNC
jgi:phosphoribosylanthranilate isomerase